MEASQSPSEREYPERQEHCDKHGTYTSTNVYGSRWTGCKLCAEEERAAAQAKQKAAEREERRRHNLSHSGLVGRFEDATFENFVATSADQRAVAAACREYAQSVKWNEWAGLWLIGRTGTGKTHLGSAIVRSVIEQRDAVAYIHSAREIVAKLRKTWRAKAGSYDDRNPWGEPLTEEALIHDLGHASLLVIDELGVGFGTDAEMTQLYDIVDLRYKLRRPTVVISNLAAGDELKQALGDRAYDRLREGAKLLACTWKSYRGESASASSIKAVK